MINPTRFFRQAEVEQYTGSLAYIESQQSFFQHDQASGMIEVRMDPAKCYILLFARGASAGIYHLTQDICKPDLMGELHASFNNSPASIFSMTVPDVAGRLVWLAVESRVHSKSQISNVTEWDSWFEQQKTEKRTGLVQIASESFDGFVYFQEGEVILSESIFSTAQGFQSSLPLFRSQKANPCELTFYTFSPDSLAVQSFILRRGMTDWTRLILNRYKEMVGQKLVQIMVDQSNLSIEPRFWMVQLEGTSLWDQHFFASLDAAASVYRALLLSMDKQSSMMIGKGLTQRLISETYNQLRPEENKLMKAYRLAPPAFTV